MQVLYDLNRAWGTPPMRHETLVMKRDCLLWAGRCRPALCLDFHAPGASEGGGCYFFVPGPDAFPEQHQDAQEWTDALASAMGERFNFYRLSAGDDEILAERALEHVERGPLMRQEMADAVRGFFERLDLTGAVRTPEGPTKTRLVNLATFSAACRSAVERDGYTREVHLISDREAPGRLVVSLANIVRRQLKWDF